MITLTETAVSRVKQLLVVENDDSLALRVEAARGGCSGPSYALYFDSEIKVDDVVLDEDGVRVIADPASAELLVGATLDYLVQLDGESFQIVNPNSTGGGCGCGSGGGHGHGGGGCGGGGCGCGSRGGHDHGHRH